MLWFVGFFHSVLLNSAYSCYISTVYLLKFYNMFNNCGTNCLLLDFFKCLPFCEWKMLPATSWKKGVAAIKPLQPLLMVRPEGTQAGDRWADSATAAPPLPPNCAPWGNLGWESTGCWPQRAEVHSEGMISESRLLHLAMHRKARNSLTWFSLINSTLWMFPLPGLSWKNFCVS